MAIDRVQALRDLLAKDPRDPTTRYMLATELYKNGNYDEAADQMESYLQSKQDEGAAYRILADSYQKLGKVKEARLGAPPGDRGRPLPSSRRNGRRARRPPQRPGLRKFPDSACDVPFFSSIACFIFSFSPS